MPDPVRAHRPEPGRVGAGASAPDLAVVAATFGARLRDAGLAVGPDRVERFARAVALVAPDTVAELRWCAHATLAGDLAGQRVLDRVFDEVFGGYADPAGADRGGTERVRVPAPREGRRHADAAAADLPAGWPVRADRDLGGGGGAVDGGSGAGVPALASDLERLRDRDFAELTDDELAALRAAMAGLVLATPPRSGRRCRPWGHGGRVDLRSTLRRSYRSGGDPAVLIRHVPRRRPRRLVVLCDISGSMQAYARAMVQLLYCAAGGARAEVFTFATRLTRLTPVLAAAGSPDLALGRAGRAAPDWAGGTRIAAAVKEFVDGYGRRGMARGAVVVIVSDGWETGDPGELDAQMTRLSGLAYRIVWVNPRTARPGYRPLVGGMAAAWPHCDSVVSAHRLTALAPLTDALADPVRRRARPRPKER